MPTPNRDEARERALELFFQDNIGATTPEDYELKESGYWAVAVSELMRGESVEQLAYVEQLAHDVGRRIVTEAEHDKLIDLELKMSKVKEDKAKLKMAKLELESMRAQLDQVRPERPPEATRIIVAQIKQIKEKRKVERTRQVKSYEARRGERLPPSERIPAFPPSEKMPAMERLPSF